MNTRQDQNPRDAEPMDRQWTHEVEEGVKGALARLRLPKRDQLLEARERIERLAARVERLEQESSR